MWKQCKDLGCAGRAELPVFNHACLLMGGEGGGLLQARSLDLYSLPRPQELGWACDRRSRSKREEEILKKK